MHDLNETNPGLMLFSAELPWCCFCAEIKVLGMERNFARIFYSNKENFWSQEPPEGGTWVGTTHQGAPPQARLGGLSPPGGPADPETNSIKSHYSRNIGDEVLSHFTVRSRRHLFFIGRPDLESVWGSGKGVFDLRHHQPSFIANSMMLPTGSE